MANVIGVDVGGTFTDVVTFDGDTILGHKVPTSADQSVAVAEAVGGGGDDVFLHGTTAATNALLEERGGRVALVTDAGYEDLLEIGRQDRPSLYDSAADRPTPLVPRELRVSDPADIGDCDVVAVVLIDSYKDPSREREIAEAVDKPVLLSSDISPEFREFERTATTVLSAYLTPSVADYLRSLDARLEMKTRLIMTSSGGLIPFEGGTSSAGRLVLSGPAGGAVAAAALGRHHGVETVLSFDMGGTSTDVCRITGGVLSVGSGHTIAGRVNRVPSVPIRTIGAGGGSIAWVDPGGALRVGPQSAGAEPGPASYSRGGTLPTVTDANVAAGHIPSDLALGGTVALDVDAARSAIARLGEQIGLSEEQTTVGILEVVDSHMEHALRSVSVVEGADPREAVLVAFGGAGGLHASRLARRLGMATVLMPPLSGVFSALGLMLAPPRADRTRTVMLSLGDSELASAISVIRSETTSAFSETFGVDAADLAVTVDVRYFGQSHELEVEAGSWDEIRTRFESLHRQRFGFDRPAEPIEAVNVRAAAAGSAPLSWGDLPSAPSNLTPEYRDGVWRRETLPAGFEVDGPSVVVEDNSAVLIAAEDRLRVLDDGTLEITNG